MAWIAIISLQMGMFVCGAGIDVCHAADAPAHVELQQSNSDTDSAPVDQVCAAHAAHVFLGQTLNKEGAMAAPIEIINLLSALHIPEVMSLIEQPPKLLHS